MRIPSHAIAAALLAGALLAAATAQADSGIAPTPGNALNPVPINPTTAGRWMDEEGLGTRVPAARTPTGQFYNIPLDPGEEADAKESAATWKRWGFIELGGLHVGGDAKSQGFLNYKDLQNGAYINSFGVLAEKRDEARYFEATGGGVGMHDQFYRLQFGRYNDWKVTAIYDEVPQVFTTTYRSLWNGVGSANLNLVSLAPGGATNAAATQASIQSALAATGNSELEAIRRKAGVRFDKTLGDSWKFFASYVNDKREGARPFGTVFGGGGGGGNIETAESIDYDTHDFIAGFQFSNAASSFNLRASASFFRNDIDTMTVQNPLFVSLNGSTGLNPTSFTQARFDLAPNNEHYNVKGEYARSFPDLYKGYFTAAVALGTMRQNDNLVAPTEFPLTGGAVTAGGVSLANAWNTTDALSRQTANARIDTRLADFGLLVKPADKLEVRGKVRYYETDNSMNYLACNPLTGQWGRLLNDGSGLSLVTANTVAGQNPAGTSANAYNAVNCVLAAAQALNLVPAAGNIPIGSIPYDYKQLNTSVAADYRLTRSSSVDATIERETYKREFRERDRTWEDRIKLGYVDRGSIEGTIRVSYEHSQRGGSAYNSNPYESFYSSSFGPTPTANTVAMSSWFHALEQFRSFDLANRSQNTLNGRINYAFLPNLDGAMTLQMKDAEFPADYGRTGHQRSNSATLDVSWQSGSSAVLYAFYSFQKGSMDQRGVQPNSCILGNTYYFFSDGSVQTAATGAAAPAAPAGTTLVSTQSVAAANWMRLCGSASPTSPLFPESRAWEVASKDRNDVIGAGFKYDLGKARLETSYTRTLGRTKIGYAYNPAALGMTPVQAALAGNGFSDLTLSQNVFNASVVVPINPTVSLRFLLRYESGKIRDWHYDGVAANPLPANNAAYLDAGPQDYKVTVIGLFFQIRI